jgi:thymidylate synthase
MSSPFLHAYRDIVARGKLVKPRGEAILEIENATLVFEPHDSIVSSFKDRNLKLQYCKQEFLWYLRGDRFDDEIEKYSSAWAKIRQKDGGYNSNYGQYMFGDSGQFVYVVETLLRDRDSRRACMVLLNAYHLYHENTDTVCTYSLSFRIRENKLNMTVNMRSNDVIFGTTNDVFCFGLIHRMVLCYLQMAAYPFLELGNYAHRVDSLHVYERHWEMIGRLTAQGMKNHYDVPIPQITYDDLDWLIKNPKKVYNESGLEFAQWITN